MVTIALHEKSIPDFINAGLTSRHYEKKDKKTKILLIPEVNINKFWKNIHRYVDKEDNSLTIINIPLPSENILDAMNLESYNHSIIYLSHKQIPLTRSKKLKLIDNNISPIPQRLLHKCFVGNYTGRIENRWMNICKNISFEPDIGRVLSDNKDIINGIIDEGLNNPIETIKKISENDTDSFKEIGRTELPEINSTIQIRNARLSYVEGTYIDLMKILINQYFDYRNTPVAMISNDESLVLTQYPSFTNEIIKQCKIRKTDEIKLGKAKTVVIDPIEDRDFLVFLGRIIPNEIIITYSTPNASNQRTLKRRIMGEETTEGRKYKGIIDYYPEIEFLNGAIITPKPAVEDVIDALTETEAVYKIRT